MVDDGKAYEGHQADGCTREFFRPHAKCRRQQDQTEDQYKIRQGRRQRILKTVSIKRPLMRSLLGSSAREESWDPNCKTTDQRHLRRHNGIGKG